MARPCCSFSPGSLPPTVRARSCNGLSGNLVCCLASGGERVGVAVFAGMPLAELLPEGLRLNLLFLKAIAAAPQ